MRIDSPNPKPRTDADYETWTSGGYGDPNGEIFLDEKRELSLRYISLDDARRLRRAAAQIEEKLAACHAQMVAPHGSAHLYKGTCQLCGKPEGDELHAEAKP